MNKSLWGVVIALLSLFTFIEWSHVLYHMRQEAPQSRTSSQLAFARYAGYHQPSRRWDRPQQTRVN